MRAPTPTALARWSSRLAFDLALQLSDSNAFDLEEILRFHGLTEPQLIEIAGDPVFQRQVQQFKEEIREKGLVFRTKAKIIADELLQTSWQLIHDQDTSPAVKADLIKSVVRWADYEPKPKESNSGGDGSGVRITINLGSTQPARVIEAEKVSD